MVEQSVSEVGEVNGTNGVTGCVVTGWNIEALEPGADFIAEAARNVTSQFGEDGMVEALFGHIGTTTRRCFEIGAHDGTWYSNTKALRDAGWTALLIEGDENKFQTLKRLASPTVFCVHKQIEGDDLDYLLGDWFPTGEEIDFGVIDVDGQDYWLWTHLERRPRVLLVEFAPIVDRPPPEEGCERFGDAHQAGITAIINLGRSKGYVPLVRNVCNVLFCRADVWRPPVAEERVVLKFDADNGPCYPLDHAADSVDEITAVNVLDRFDCGDVPTVLAEWVRVLKPGGKLRVSVPDFYETAQAYLQRRCSLDTMAFTKTPFDRGTLSAALVKVGLKEVRHWQAPTNGNGRNVMLHMQAHKPQGGPKQKLPSVRAVLSLPRLAFTDNMFCGLAVCGMLGIPFLKTTGAYWDKCLERSISRLLEEHPSLEWVLTIDYDSVFRPQNVVDLLRLAADHPEADAIAPIQVKRSGRTGEFLFTILQPDGSPYPPENVMTREHFKGDLSRAAGAHFGLTLLRAEKLRKLPHPWMFSIPNRNGRWEDGAVDPDVAFWHHWRAHGNTLYIANRVPIGHDMLMVAWPDADGGITYQTCDDFWHNLEPENLWR